MSTDALWRKSSYSNGAGECVEVALDRARVAVRDSKDRTGPVLVVTSAEWRTFLGGVVDGAFDRP